MLPFCDIYRKLKTGEINWLIQHHTADKWQNWNRNPVSLTSSLCSFDYSIITSNRFSSICWIEILAIYLSLIFVLVCYSYLTVYISGRNNAIFILYLLKSCAESTYSINTCCSVKTFKSKIFLYFLPRLGLRQRRKLGTQWNCWTYCHQWGWGNALPTSEQQTERLTKYY